MAFKGFNDETLQKLEKEGVTDDDKTITTNPADDKTKVIDSTLPDINLVDKAEQEKAADAAKLAEETAKKAEEQKILDDKKSKEDINAEVFDPFVTKKLEDGGFSIDAVKERMLKDKGITPEFEKELKEKIDPDLVDTYLKAFNTELEKNPIKDNSASNEDIIASNKAKVEMNDFIYNSVGGEDNFGIMAGALAANLSKDEVAVINAKLDSSNKALVTEGMEQAVKAYKKLTGREGKRMEGDPNGTQTTEFVFMSKDMYQKAITSEKYRTDKAYAQKVDDDRIKSMQMDNAETMPGQYRNVRNGQMYNL